MMCWTPLGIFFFFYSVFKYSIELKDELLRFGCQRLLWTSQNTILAITQELKLTVYRIRFSAEQFAFMISVHSGRTWTSMVYHYFFSKDWTDMWIALTWGIAPVSSK